MQNANQKHLTLEDRNYIEQALNQNMTFKEIAKFLSKDATTISKEVRKHRTRKAQNTFNNYSANVCAKRFNCSKKISAEEIVVSFVISAFVATNIVLTLKNKFVLL